MRLWDSFGASGDELTDVGAVEVPHPATLGESVGAAFDSQIARASYAPIRYNNFARPLVEDRADKLAKITGIPREDWIDDALKHGPWAGESLIYKPTERARALRGAIADGTINQRSDGTLEGLTDAAASMLEGNEDYAKRLLLIHSLSRVPGSGIASDDMLDASVAQAINGAAAEAQRTMLRTRGLTKAAGELVGGAGGFLLGSGPETTEAMVAGGFMSGTAKAGVGIFAKMFQAAKVEAAAGFTQIAPAEVDAKLLNDRLRVPYTWREAAVNTIAGTLLSAGLGAGIPVVRAAGGVVRDSARALGDYHIDLADFYDAAKAKDPAIATADADRAAAALREAVDVSRTAPVALDAPQEAAHATIVEKARDDLDAGDTPVVERQAAALRATLPAEAPFADADLPMRRRLTPDDLEAFDPAGLEVDPALFQFKGGGDAHGVTDRLRDIKTFEPAQAGTVLVWERADGKLFIADGHQRMGIARRAIEAGQDPAGVFLSGYRIRESDGVTPQHARVLAAFKNIGEGTGSAVDVAKIYREAHRDLVASMPQLSGNNALARDGRNLSKLGDAAFGMVVNDVVRPEFGAVVGEILKDPGEQVAAIDVLRRSEPANAGEARAIVEQVRAAGFTRAAQASQGGLFSDADFAASLFKERAQILQGAKAEVRRDLSTFRTLGKQKGRISQAGNKLAEKQNLAKVAEDEVTLTEIDRLANVAGPIADALNLAARRLNAGELGRQEAIGAFVGDLRKAATSTGRSRPVAGAGQPGAKKPVTRAQIGEQVEAHPRLSNEQKGQLLSLYDEALAALPHFEKVMSELAARVGGRLKMGPLKGVARATEKILDEEGGDFGKLRDLVRGTIEVDSVADLMRAAGEIEGLELVGPTMRNGYAPGARPLPGGYRDAKANVRIAGHDAEIQVNLPEMLAAKDKAHPLYEEWRVLQAKKVAAGGEVDEAMRAHMADLLERQRELYAAAFSTIERKAASAIGEPLRSADAALNGREPGTSNATASTPSGETVTGMPSTSKKNVPGGNDSGSDIATSTGNDITGQPKASAAGVELTELPAGSFVQLGSQRIQVSSLADARRAHDLFTQRLMEEGFASSTAPTVAIVTADGAPIGHFSWNGRAWAEPRDLLGDNTGAAQALADETAKRDSARNAGQVDLETGDPSDLFSAARNQANLFDQPTAVRALERAQDLIAAEPERMVTITDAAGVDRQVPASQAFADLDAEEAALRRVALCATPGEG